MHLICKGIRRFNEAKSSLNTSLSKHQSHLRGIIAEYHEEILVLKGVMPPSWQTCDMFQWFAGDDYCSPYGNPVHLHSPIFWNLKWCSPHSKSPTHLGWSAGLVTKCGSVKRRGHKMSEEWRENSCVWILCLELLKICLKTWVSDAWRDRCSEIIWIHWIIYYHCQFCLLWWYSMETGT